MNNSPEIGQKWINKKKKNHNNQTTKKRISGTELTKLKKDKKENPNKYCSKRGCYRLVDSEHKQCTKCLSISIKSKTKRSVNNIKLENSTNIHEQLCTNDIDLL
jgi:catalase